jgi:polyphosphate kinase
MPKQVHTEPETRPLSDDLSIKDIYLNRELSWLEFNRRVLHEALDDRTPLLERVTFLGIFSSNLDEFFMKRVGGFKRQVAAGVAGAAIDGMTPTRQLSAIRHAVIPMLQQQAACFTHDLLPALRKHNIQLLHWKQLGPAELAFARDYFHRNIFPVVTPFAVDPGHPFPFISNLSQSLGVVLTRRGHDDKLFARVKIPEVFPPWLRLEPDPAAPTHHHFLSLTDLISHNLDALFPGMNVLSVTPFRVTRNADVEADEEDTADLIELIEEELRQRRLSEIVRLEHGPNPDPWCIKLLTEELGLTETDVYELPAELDYTGLKSIADLELPSLKYDPWNPAVPPALTAEDSDIFSVIRAADLLVHHPYESFSATVERFIGSAANDPKVLAIKITLYRVGDSFSLMNSLIRAAESGKEVVCLVELKARFDEQTNIYWAQRLEKIGVKVVYGIVGLKTHTKLALVVRQQDPDGLRCYAHIGTGNYNIQTSRLYTDLGLFTANPAITNEVVELFHYLTGRSMKADYRELLVAPITMRTRFTELIAREIDNHHAGKPARIIAKINSLEDQRIMHSLRLASQAGVPIDLIVRGFCCLRPAVPGLTDNIRVVSVIGRFLEHSRIFYFRSAAHDEPNGQFFIGSADWMYRNLNNRVEVVAPIHDPIHKQKLWFTLNTLLNDPRQGWDLKPDGSYTQRQPNDPHQHLGAHATLMKSFRRSTGPDPASLHPIH